MLGEYFRSRASLIERNRVLTNELRNERDGRRVCEALLNARVKSLRDQLAASQPKRGQGGRFISAKVGEAA